jgi:hypothetical protein
MHKIFIALLAILIKTLIFYLSFNALAPKLAVMHGQPDDSFNLTFVQSLLMIIVIHSLIW